MQQSPYLAQKNEERLNPIPMNTESIQSASSPDRERAPQQPQENSSEIDKDSSLQARLDALTAQPEMDTLQNRLGALQRAARSDREKTSFSGH